jgi:hypothetical protein
MNINDALAMARVIQQARSANCLCGSLALMLADRIPKREVHDLDFVTNKDVGAPESIIYASHCYDGYAHYQIGEPHFHCLFYLPDLEYGPVIDGFQLQSIKQIIFWKKQFGRVKDLEDIKGGKIVENISSVLAGF